MAEPYSDLLERAKLAPEGDLRAFEELVRQFQGQIVANCRYITRDVNNAEDLAQEVFAKAYFGMSNFEGRSSVRHWLQKIKINHCLNHLKKQANKMLINLEDGEISGAEQLRQDPTAHQSVESQWERQRIDRVLDSMSTTLRIPLVLRDMDDLSYEEIAITLGVSLSAIKMRIKRAREEFRRLYQAGSAAA